jgi:NadR type nicotinamide-nucleotide adenylyltransferase
MTRRPSIVIISGAESTGKSVLTKQLGLHFSSHFFPEYAREYLEKKGSVYTYNDVETIAKAQQTQMEEAVKLKTPFVFFDTWLIITKVWFEVVYGKVPSWITDAISNAPIDLFLLCANDIPWNPDPLRENGGTMRERLFELYRTNIAAFGFKYDIVSGIGEKRVLNAIEIIRKFL